jgi:hypothetical protein
MLTPSVVVSREAYLAIGGMDEGLPCREDTHLFFALGFHAPVCAVAGTGAVVGDDAPVRLTHMLELDEGCYWNATVRMYGDLLERVDGAAPAVAAQLRGRRAVAHLRLARLAWRQRRPGRFLAELARAVRQRPRLLAERLVSHVKG